MKNAITFAILIETITKNIVFNYELTIDHPGSWLHRKDDLLTKIEGIQNLLIRSDNFGETEQIALHGLWRQILNDERPTLGENK